MKREAVEDTAYGVGFFEGILKVIPEDVVFESFQEITGNGWITPDSTIPEIKNIVVTESIRRMTYQEFKEVGGYLFSYPQAQRDKDQALIVQTVEITEAQYQEFQDAIRELMQIKTEAIDLLKNTQPEDSVSRFDLTHEEIQLKEIAEDQITYLKSQELWEIGSVDYYKFGFMPDDLIDSLLADKEEAYGDESDRTDYENYFGWFKAGGEVSNTLIAMPGTSLVDDLIFGDVNLQEDFSEEVDSIEFKKLINSLRQLEDNKSKDLDKNNEIGRLSK